MASESAGRNHHLAIALQSAEQLTVLYGEKAASLHDLFGTKMAGSGVSSVPTLQRLEMVGGGDAAERQDRDSKKSPMKGDRLLSHEIAALREHHWLTISQSTSKELHPMAIKGNAYWKVSPFKERSEGLDPLLATPLARWFSRVRQAKRNLPTKRTSPTAPTGGTIRAEIGATEELIGEEYALVKAESREAVRNGALAIKTAIGGALGGLKRSRIAPLSVQSGSSAERALGMRREKVIRHGSDVGHVIARVAYRDDEGTGSGRGSTGLSWPPDRVPGLRLPDESKPWDVLPGSSEADRRATAAPSGAPQAVAVAAPPKVPLPAASIVNRHPTKCDLCGQPVPSGEVWIWKEDGQWSWLGRHQSCPGTRG
jgi:hypothetical protein